MKNNIINIYDHQFSTFGELMDSKLIKPVLLSPDDWYFSSFEGRLVLKRFSSWEYPLGKRPKNQLPKRN